MKIAEITPLFHPVVSGVGKAVYETSKNLVKLGHEVHVYTSDYNGEKGRIEKKEEIIDGIHIHRCKYLLRIGKFATLWPSVYSKLLKENFNIIHSHNFGQPHCLFSALAAKKKKIPHFLTTHASFLGQTERNLLLRFLVALNYQTFGRLSLKLSKVIAISDWEKKELNKLGIKNFEIIPNGVDEIYFKKIKNNNFKKEHNLGKFILYVGRLEKRKGPQVILDIAKKLPDYDFVFIGPDSGMKDFLEKNKTSSIKILGRTSETEKIKAYQSAHIFVLPSKREGLPLTLFEALASGLPVIATNTDGIPYYIKENQNGFLTKYNDSDKIIEKIKILENKKVYSKIRNNNIKTAKSFTWQKISKSILNLYQTSFKS